MLAAFHAVVFDEVGAGGGQTVGLPDGDGAVAGAVPQDHGHVEGGRGGDLVDGVEVLTAAARDDPFDEACHVPRHERRDAHADALRADGVPPVQRGAVQHDAQDRQRVRTVLLPQDAQGDVAAHREPVQHGAFVPGVLRPVQRGQHVLGFLVAQRQVSLRGGRSAVRVAERDEQAARPGALQGREHPQRLGALTPVPVNDDHQRVRAARRVPTGRNVPRGHVAQRRADGRVLERHAQLRGRAVVHERTGPRERPVRQHATLARHLAAHQRPHDLPLAQHRVPLVRQEWHDPDRPARERLGTGRQEHTVPPPTHRHDHALHAARLAA